MAPSHQSVSLMDFTPGPLAKCAGTNLFDRGPSSDDLPVGFQRVAFITVVFCKG